MNFKKKLEQNGIFPEEKINIEKKIEIAKEVANRLSEKFNSLIISYNEIYMRIYNCDIYYAQIDPKFNGVFYYYKNNSLYISRDKLLDEYMLHEIIHYMQNFRKMNKQSKIGLCRFEEFRILAFGINEAVVQYITAKALGNKIQRINYNNISICTNSPTYYKFLTSLAYQLIYLIGEDEAINSCLNSKENFIENMYNTFEEQTEKILKKFDEILDENNKKPKNEEKIVKLYFETQEIIYTTYFSKVMRYLEEAKDVDKEVEKLENYQEVIGKVLGESEVNSKFLDFKSKNESRLLKKYVEITRKKSKNDLPILYRGLAYKVFEKIKNFFRRKRIDNRE